MSVIRVGSSGQYAAGWDAIFGGAKVKPAGGAKRAKKAAKKVAKKVAKKSAKKAKSRRG